MLNKLKKKDKYFLMGIACTAIPLYVVVIRNLLQVMCVITLTCKMDNSDKPYIIMEYLHMQFPCVKKKNPFWVFTM